MSEDSLDEGGAPKAMVIRASLASTFYLTMRLLLLSGAIAAACARSSSTRAGRPDASA